MANHVRASCGHHTVAIGFEGSLMRHLCESSPCSACRNEECIALSEPRKVCWCDHCTSQREDTIIRELRRKVGA